MLLKTSGIVINYLKYRESSIIVRIFTRELGLKSYIVNSVRSPKAKTKMGFFQPLTILDLVVYDKEKANLNRISEVKLKLPYHCIPFDFQRSGVAMFVGEVLGKVIYEDYQNEALFDFLTHALSHLDQQSTKLHLYPQSFLLETAKFLGFGSDDPHELFSQLYGLSQQDDFIKEEKGYLGEIMDHPFSNDLKVPAVFRKKMLDDLLAFYKIHVEGFSELKSIKVLRSLN
ncbi:DNA repair protein RecO [Litoribacter populi]|uniref:DNA repair protein RecO n=1 Tax=Litoribacter populi TaxID=2598460 RepID=UPI00117C644E|nr:DNA repair protein RecO [Litoribacter populi]